MAPVGRHPIRIQMPLTTLSPSLLLGQYTDKNQILDFDAAKEFFFLLLFLSF